MYNILWPYNLVGYFAVFPCFDECSSYIERSCRVYRSVRWFLLFDAIMQSLFQYQEVICQGHGTWYLKIMPLTILQFAVRNVPQENEDHKNVLLQPSSIPPQSQYDVMQA